VKAVGEMKLHNVFDMGNSEEFVERLTKCGPEGPPEGTDASTRELYRVFSYELNSFTRTTQFLILAFAEAGCDIVCLMYFHALLSAVLPAIAKTS
jgi:hypothetical protein